MPYVTSIERLSLCDGLREGIESMLDIRFGADGLGLMPEIRAIYEEDKLRAILQSIKTAANPEDVRRVWLTPSRN